MTFVRYFAAAPGEPLVIPAVTIHAEQDARRFPLGYRIEHGPGQQGASHATPA